MKRICIILRLPNPINIFSERAVIPDGIYNSILWFFYIFLDKSCCFFNGFSRQKPLSVIYFFKIIEVYNLKKDLEIMIYCFFLCSSICSCFTIYCIYQIFSGKLSLICLRKIKTCTYLIKEMLFYVLIYLLKIKLFIFSEIQKDIFFIVFDLNIYSVWQLFSVLLTC